MSVSAELQLVKDNALSFTPVEQAKSALESVRAELAEHDRRIRGYEQDREERGVQGGGGRCRLAQPGAAQAAQAEGQ
jgi:hypothetical protein